MSTGSSRGDPTPRGTRAVRSARPARRRGRLRLLILATAVVVVAVVVAVVVLRPSGPDPFVGVYWDPDSGRRVEITQQGDGYRLLYGVAKRGYAAQRYGDELQVRDPFSGYVIVRATDEGLLLVSGKRETKLEPLPADK